MLPRAPAHENVSHSSSAGNTVSKIFRKMIAPTNGMVKVVVMTEALNGHRANRWSGLWGWLFLFFRILSTM
ncbi:hypothetical protein PM082_020036 [Marasmius tenuissimus]|nr:hypothetical protein PM082_020036 [Marasmius tenuissimus]